MERIRNLLLHISMICTLVCITAKVLDWYNPFMDFTGHIWIIQYALYLAVAILEITNRGCSHSRV